MDWLKDKKNLPIVVGLAVFVLLAAGGLIAFETGLFSGSPAPASVASSPAAGGPIGPGSYPPGSPGSPASSSYPGSPSYPGRPPTDGAASYGGRAASTLPAVSKSPNLINPAKGPDPFSIPGGQKIYQKQVVAALVGTATGMPPPLRELLPRYDLFTIHAPPPPAVVVGPNSDPGSQNYKLTGILNSEGSVLAIMETGGQSQTVKPGDSLPDGGKVVSIQESSITLRTPGGSTVTVPLSTGSGSPDQFQNGQNGQNGQFGQDPNQPNFPGQPFNP